MSRGVLPPNRGRAARLWWVALLAALAFLATPIDRAEAQQRTIRVGNATPPAALQVSGSGFPANQPIEIRIGAPDSRVRGEATTTASGNFAATAVTDGLSPGASVVRVCACRARPAVQQAAQISVLAQPRPVINVPANALAGQTVRLDGRGSSGAGAQLNLWEWTLRNTTTGGAAIIRRGALSDVTLTRPGVYDVTLVVGDTAGRAASTSANITVSAPPAQPPVAIITAPSAVQVGQRVQLRSNLSTDDGSIVGYDWQFGDGGRSGNADPSHVWTTPGAYRISLRVTDDSELTNSDTALIQVLEAPPISRAPAPNVGPIARAGQDKRLQPGDTAMFDGSSSVDPDGEIVSYSWDFGDGSRSSNRRVRHTFNQPGTFTVRLVVTDTDGATAVDSAQVIAAAPGIVNPDDPTDPDQAPTTDDSDGPDTSNDELDPEEVTRLDLGGPYELEAGESLSLASPTEIGDSSPVGFAWDFGDGSTATTPEITHTWEFPGRFTISLTVELADGSTAFADSIVTVRAPDLGDGAPIPDIGGPYTVVAGRSLTLDGSASRDPDGEVVKWEWNVGADELLEGETVQHTFGAAGTYPIVLRVTDDDGNSELTTASVEVFPVECALTEDQVRDFRARPRVATTQNALTTLRLVVAVDCAGLQVAFAVDGRVVDPRVSIGPAGLAESTFRMPGDLDPGVHPITTLVGDDGDVLVESTWELSLGDGTPCDLTANQIKETTARPSGNGVRVTIDLVRVPNCDVQPVMVEISGGPTEVTPRSLDVDSKTTSITMSASGGVAPGDYEVRVSAGDETISETGVTLRSPDAERGFSFWWIAGAMAITATILAVFAVPFFFRNVTIPGL